MQYVLQVSMHPYLRWLLIFSNKQVIEFSNRKFRLRVVFKNA
jgi:hypothetical protein